MCPDAVLISGVGFIVAGENHEYRINISVSVIVVSGKIHTAFFCKRAGLRDHLLRAGVVVIAAHVLSVIFPVVRQSDYVADIKSEIVHIAELSFEIVLCRAGGSVVGIATLVHHIHEILFRICECHIRICREDDYSVFLDRSCTGFRESHGLSHLFPFKCKFIVEFRPARCCPLYELGIRDLSAGGFGGNVVHSHLDS